MKKVPIRILKKRLECLLWLWIIVLFLMTYHGKVEEAKAVLGAESDIYEEDDQPGKAWPIVVNNPQLHTFHTDNDIDWVYFFGHAGYNYHMKADDGTPCYRFIKLSLTDPNGKIIISQAGSPVMSTSCKLPWKCPEQDGDGYYCLKIEPPSEFPPEGISYNLFIEHEPAGDLGGIFGRVVNSKHRGINGLRVNMADTNVKTWTGSIKNVRDNTLDPLMMDGWFFIIAWSGKFDLRITEDDPNVILIKVPDINLSPNNINRIKDIVLDHPSGEADVVKDFDSVYTEYQIGIGRDYPVWEDKDNDGANNQYEILYGTDPDNPYNMPCNMDLPQGWSLISIPIISESASVSELFPDAEVVYAYEKGSGYKRVKETDELEAGSGYWILLKDEKNYIMTGRPIFSYTLSVNEDGWEMIGGCTYAAKPLVDGCHINVIYRYDNEIGYERVNDSEDLEPGQGYWILLNDIVGQCELKVEGD